jgi:putative protein kinase ArgK-like GTPase of G3E family
VVRAIGDHYRYLETSEELAGRNRARLAGELEHILRDELMARLLDNLDEDTLARCVAQVAAREIDPYTAARHLLASTTHA